MLNPQRLIFIHGLEGSSQGIKATLLRQRYPQILTPDFPGDLPARMEKLNQLLAEEQDWTIVGSSFGGLMGALYTTQHPERVRKLILLAPALIWPDFAAQPPEAVDNPTVVYHGRRDAVIPLALARQLAEQVFTNLTFHEVDDDHGLYQTVNALDWSEVLA